jgi:hypothetical protein
MSCLVIVSNGNYQQNGQNLHMWESKPNLLQICVRTSVSKKVSFKTENTTGKLLKVNKSINKNLLNVVFNQLACPDCNMKYIRQTGRPFHVKFKVHFCDFKYENGKSKFALVRQRI